MSLCLKTSSSNTNWVRRGSLGGLFLSLYILINLKGSDRHCNIVTCDTKSLKFIAICGFLCENDEVSFIDFMKAKGDQHYLEPQPMWLKMVIPNSTVSREYGLSRAAEKVRDHLHGILKAYSEEELIVEKNDKDEVVKRMIGMYRIPDPMLLEEMIQYTEDGNFDRIVAAELALAQAKYMDPIFGKVNQEKDSRILSLGKKHIIPSVFGSSKPAFFRQKRNKLFL